MEGMRTAFAMVKSYQFFGIQHIDSILCNEIIIHYQLDLSSLAQHLVQSLIEDILNTTALVYLHSLFTIERDPAFAYLE